MTQSGFVKDHMFVVKGLLLMRVVESIYLVASNSIHVVLWVVFPSRKIFVEEILSNLVEKTMNTYVVLALVDCLLTICTFDL